MDERLSNISERITLIDGKLTSIGKTLNGNIIQNIIIFLLSIVAIFPTGIAGLLPPLYNLTPEKYLQLVPVAILYSFVQFGFVSLRGLNLMAERDKLIRELKRVSPVDLQRLRIIFRSDSFLEVFYKTLIFDGEEPTKIYKAFVIFWIILIVCGNTVFLFWFMIKNIIAGNAVMAIFLVIAALTSLGAYRDYWFKARKLRADMSAFFKD